MVVYRLARTKYAKDLSGEGARLFGGRWNHPLTPCLYTSASRALAVLEYTVNVNIDDIPRALSLVTIEIPETFLELAVTDLPGNWREAPAPAATKDFGTALLKENAFPVLKVPSTIIPEEYNYLINPLHAQGASCEILDVRDFIFDIRIKVN